MRLGVPHGRRHERLHQPARLESQVGPRATQVPAEGGLTDASTQVPMPRLWARRGSPHHIRLPHLHLRLRMVQRGRPRLMADYTHTTWTWTRRAWVIPSPTNVAEIGK